MYNVKVCALINWKEYYKQHLMSAEDAVNHIQSGNRVVVAHACGEPSYLLDVMVANAKAYRDVEIDREAAHRGR